MLADLKRQSADINKAWPEENRFQAQVTDFGPLVLIQYSFRTHAYYAAFARGYSSKDKRSKWLEIDSDSQLETHRGARTEITLEPIHPAPNGRLRYLVRLVYFGCAGSLGLTYDIQQWEPNPDGGYTVQLIHQEGALGLEAKNGPITSENPFPTVGELKVSGAVVSLPYCWFSGIDFWDNPTLCAVDTYNFSDVEPMFVSRRYNRPDLVPVAKVLQFATSHDLPALRSYCASDRLAHRLLRSIPPHGGDLQIKKLGLKTELVDLGSASFTVEMRQHRWIVTGVHADEQAVITNSIRQ